MRTSVHMSLLGGQMAVGFGVKVFGARGGVRVSTKGVGYGVGAGPLKASGGQRFGSNSSAQEQADAATVIAVIVAAVVVLGVGIGVVLSFIPLAVASILLLVPFKSTRSRYIALGAAALIYGFLARSGWNYFDEHYFSRASDPDSSGAFTGAVVVVATGLIIGIACASLAFVYSIVRGKHLYDQIYLRPEE